MEERFKEWKVPEMEHGKLTIYNWLPYYPKNIKMGNKVDIGAFTCLFAHEGIEIGNNVQIGSHCSIYSYDSERNIRGKIIIRDNVCIGSHSVILPKKNEVHIIDKNIKAGSIIY